MLTKSNLHAYQHRAVDFILEKKTCALFLQMGLGKSISTLTAIEDLMYDSFEISKVLIIAPLRVCKSVWKQEAAKWEHTKNLTFVDLSGGKANMLKGLNRRGDIYLINRENIKALVHELGVKGWKKFDMVVIDESSSFKSHASQRFKALKQVIHNSEYVVLLTGTPSPNSYLDLWSQFYLLDGGYRLGKTIGLYRNRYFRVDFFGHNYDIVDGSVKQIQDKIEDLVLSMQAEDYLDLPDFIPTVLGNKLDGKLLKEYKKLEKDMMLKLDSGDKVTAVSAATLTNKLLQFCSGNMYDAEKNVHHFHDIKIDTLKEIIEENPNDNILVAYNYKHELEALQRAFPQSITLDKKGEAVEAWNNGDIPLLLAHPACLTEDVEVLTEHSGWVKIIDVKVTDRVYDGVEFVTHSGCQYSGYKEVINVHGIEMTKDHKLLINNEWVKAEDVKASRREASYRYNGGDTYLSKMLSVSNGIYDDVSELQKTQQTWRQTLQTLYKRYFPQHDKHSNMENMEGYVGEGEQQKGCKLWGSWDFYRRKMVELQRVSQRYGKQLSRQLNTRTEKCERRLLQSELCVGNNGRTATEQANNSLCGISTRKDDVISVSEEDSSEQMCVNNSIEQGDDSRRSCEKCVEFNIRKDGNTKIIEKDVYDLVDCGKRTRFLIRNKDGDVFVSHNSAGHGLNLQHGGSLIVWYGFTWSLELYQQFNARLHRQGQTDIVRCMHIAVGEVEENLMRALTLKDVTQAELLRSLK